MSNTANSVVLVHGGFVDGSGWDGVYQILKKDGYDVTIVQNPTTSLADDVAFTKRAIAEAKSDVILVGHSYGGIVISGVADRLTDRIKRLVYVNAFVPLDGQCLNDMVPPHFVGLFDAVAAANKGAVMLPFEIWRDAFINDADLELAKSAFAKLNLHPYKTFTDKITLKHALAELPVGKSYVNCRQDIALPHSMPWHPRLSERLGLFRLVECDGSHEMFFSNPARLAQAIAEAGRD